MISTWPVYLPLVVNRLLKQLWTYLFIQKNLHDDNEEQSTDAQVYNPDVEEETVVEDIECQIFETSYDILWGLRWWRSWTSKEEKENNKHSHRSLLTVLMSPPFPIDQYSSMYQKFKKGQKTGKMAKETLECLYKVLLVIGEMSKTLIGSNFI